jgi:isoleucyl-tRNA synthetase
LAALDSVAAAATLEAGEPVTVTLAGEPVELTADEVELRVRPQPGFSVSRESGEVVALDLAMDEDLRKRGLAREVVRLVQDLRKTSGLDVSDRIRLHVVGLDLIEEHFDFIAREVLAVEMIREPGAEEGTILDLNEELLEQPVRVWLQKAS